jgi:hypothetical protein
MRKLVITIIATSLFFASCTTSKKHLVHGNYDAAINKAIPKLMKSQKNGDQILIIDKAYKIVTNQDMERVKFLKMENNPGNWEEITNIYEKLIARQSLIKTVTPYTYRGVTYQYSFTDFNQALIEAKRKASEYLYNNGKKEMAIGTKESIRNAWSNFVKTKELSGDYYSVDELILQCEEMGTTNVLIQAINDTHFKLSPEFMDNILLFKKNNLNNFWVKYHTRHLDNEIAYDYFLNIKLKNIAVSPNEVEEHDKFEEREVENGWDYVLDRKGNVMKDSLGNDIKVKKYKTLKCSVVNTVQFKSSIIEGVVEYLSHTPPTLIEQVPVSIQMEFEHHSARAIGDWDALSKESRRLCKTEAMPFPTDEEMVYRGTEKLKNEISRALRRHRNNIY